MLVDPGPNSGQMTGMIPTTFTSTITTGITFMIVGTLVSPWRLPSYCRIANEDDKNLIHIHANSVPNVFSVTDDLQLEGNEAQL